MGMGDAPQMQGSAHLSALAVAVHLPRHGAVAGAGHEDEEVLFGAGAVWEVHHKAAREADAQGRRRDQLRLLRAAGVQLQHCSGATDEAAVQRAEEALLWGRVCVWSQSG